MDMENNEAADTTSDSLQLHPLTLEPRILNLVKENWKEVEHIKPQFGHELMIRVFESGREFQEVFSEFRGKPISELRVSKRLRAHGYTLISLFGDFIGVLDEPEVLEHLLVTTGVRHHKHGATFQHFQAVLPILFALLTEKLGNNMSAAHVEAWKAATNAMWVYIGKGFEQAGSK